MNICVIIRITTEPPLQLRRIYERSIRAHTQSAVRNVVNLKIAFRGIFINLLVRRYLFFDGSGKFEFCPKISFSDKP